METSDVFLRSLFSRVCFLLIMLIHSLRLALLASNEISLEACSIQLHTTATIDVDCHTPSVAIEVTCTAITGLNRLNTVMLCVITEIIRCLPEHQSPGSLEHRLSQQTHIEMTSRLQVVCLSVQDRTITC